MYVRHKIESLIPEVPREILKDFLRKVLYPGYGVSLDGCKLKKYHVKNAEPALWSADSKKPHGTIMTSFNFAHFLLVRAVIHACKIKSWCDIGAGSATLSLQAARLGVPGILAIDGSDAALRAGKVVLPSSNYYVADVCQPLDIKNESDVPANFDVVSALELLEHIPDLKLTGLFQNIKRLEPRFVIFAIGLQPDPPYHVNLKSMSEWLEVISSMLSDWTYNDQLSVRLFENARRNKRYVNEYPTNHLPFNRNLVVFTDRKRVL